MRRFLVEQKFSCRGSVAAMAMATASPWTAVSVRNVPSLRKNSSSSSSSSLQGSCGVSVKRSDVQLRPQWRVHCRLRSSPLSSQSGKFSSGSGRGPTVVAPRAMTDEEQQTTTANVKEFLEDLKAVGRVSDFKPAVVILSKRSGSSK